MITVTVPRCGGTIFCLDLAKKFNLKFAGQAYSPKFVDDYYKVRRPNWKKISHETNAQPEFQRQHYLDVIVNPGQYSILFNGVDNALILPQADYLLLRKNIYNTFASYYKYLKILNQQFNQPTLDHQRLMWDFSLRFNCIYNICVFSLHTGKKITWYEDHYTSPDYQIDSEVLQYFAIIKQTNLDQIFVEAGGLEFAHLLQ